MSPKSIYVCIFCSLLTSKLYARDERATINLKLPTESTLESINIHLENLGIELDEISKITTHHEENYVDVTCFNCIINNVAAEDLVVGSFNERT